MTPALYYTRDAPAFTGFHSEPSGRGTVGIIWTCLNTILLSSWSSYHTPAYDPNKCFKSEARYSYLRKFAWAFLFPELGAVASFDNLYDAFQLRKTVRQVGGPQFASFSLPQVFLFVMKGVYEKPAGSTLTRVSPKMIVELVTSGSLSFSDLPTDDEIADKSKCHWTLKSLSIIQTGWFIVSIIVRLSPGYPVSLYEDITVANACCGIIEFACWFHCPQDIRPPFIIRPDISGTSDSPTATGTVEPEQEAIVQASLLVPGNASKNDASSGPHLSVLRDIRSDRPNTELRTCEQPPLTEKAVKHRASFANRDTGFREASDTLFMVLLMTFSVLFAGIHIAAWNYSFPSVTEAWIWRGSSLAITVLGFFISFGSIKYLSEDDYERKSAAECIFGSIPILYSLVRTMMLVVALMSFRKAPARLYETPSWAQYWPHV